MQPGAKVADYRVDVKRHHPMLDSNAGAVELGSAEALRVAVEVEEEPAGLSGALRDPSAAGVERSTVDPAAGCVIKHRPQRDLVAVHIGNDAKPHAGERTSA